MEELWGQAGVAGSAIAALLSALLSVFFLVVAGKLVPRRNLEDLRRDKNDQIAALRAEVATWRTTAEREAAARLQIQGQNGELLELARTAGHVLTALPTGQGVTANASVAPLPTSTTP